MAVDLVSPIASQGKACVHRFEQLCALFEDEKRQSNYKISLLQVRDSYGQFRIWAGNIGALQTLSSTSSLDYRLREVPKLLEQVIILLKDLKEALEDGTHSIHSRLKYYSLDDNESSQCVLLLLEKAKTGSALLSKQMLNDSPSMMESMGLGLALMTHRVLYLNHFLKYTRFSCQSLRQLQAFSSSQSLSATTALGTDMPKRWLRFLKHLSTIDSILIMLGISFLVCLGMTWHG